MGWTYTLSELSGMLEPSVSHTGKPLNDAAHREARSERVLAPPIAIALLRSWKGDATFIVAVS
jgi:hypothetical protein